LDPDAKFLDFEAVNDLELVTLVRFKFAVIGLVYGLVEALLEETRESVKFCFVLNWSRVSR